VGSLTLKWILPLEVFDPISDRLQAALQFPTQPRSGDTPGRGRKPEPISTLTCSVAHNASYPY
jgi:hypothetical protein